MTAEQLEGKVIRAPRRVWVALKARAAEDRYRRDYRDLAAILLEQAVSAAEAPTEPDALVAVG
jgi:hypothetical protein